MQHTTRPLAELNLPCYLNQQYIVNVALARPMVKPFCFILIKSSIHSVHAHFCSKVVVLSLSNRHMLLYYKQKYKFTSVHIKVYNDFLYKCKWTTHFVRRNLVTLMEEKNTSPLRLAMSFYKKISSPSISALLLSTSVLLRWI